MVTETEFLEAVQKGELDKVVSWLGSQPGLASAKTPEGLSAVLLAAYHGQPAIAHLLAERRRDLNIFEAAASGRVEWVRQLVEKQPALANAVAPDGFQPLGLACFFGHFEAAKCLVEHGAEINSASHNPAKVMPLHSAAASQSLEIARLLLEHKADPNARQDDDFTPLQGAAQNGQVEMAELLLSYGADLHAVQAQGQTALSIAEKAGKKEMVAFLKQQGA